MKKSTHTLKKRSMIKEFDIQRELEKLYAEGNSHKDQTEKDIACWFNLSEFAEFHTIEGQKVLGVFTSDIQGQKINNSLIAQDGTVLNKSHGILFLRCEDVSNVNVDQPLRLDGRLYQVDEAEKLGNVIWRLKLSGNLS